MIPFPNKKYQIIYADPPWPYKSKSSPNQIGKYKTIKTDVHYKSMSFSEIYNLPIQSIADDDCYLFLWVTFPLLPQCIETFKYWKFEYKTLGFSWMKTNKVNGKPFFGIGYYTKSNCEVCLIGIKGKPTKKSDKVSSVIISPLRTYSQKPDEIRNRIIEFCGNLPRIELFARPPEDRLFEDESYKGWDVWGNEV